MTLRCQTQTQFYNMYFEQQINQKDTEKSLLLPDFVMRCMTFTHILFESLIQPLDVYTSRLSG